MPLRNRGIANEPRSPFREGNGRTQRSFIGLLGEHSGHPFHFEKLNRETYLAAVIDSYFGNLPPPRDELRKLLI